MIILHPRRANTRWTMSRRSEYSVYRSGGNCRCSKWKPTPNRFEPAAVSSYLGSIVPFLDVDGDGKADPLTDGVRIVRYLLGLLGVALTTGAIAAGATRTPAQIESFILELRH